MKFRWRRDLCLVLCAVFIWLLTDAASVRQAAVRALALCAQSAIPSLFPFLVVSGLLMSLGFGEWIGPCLSGLMTPLFRLPGSASSALVLGLAGGYPIGARTAAQLYENGELTAAEAQRLLTFCNNSNPVFLISVLGTGIFGSFRAGVWLWLIHLLSALLTGVCFRGKAVPGRRESVPPRRRSKMLSFPAAFVKAVTDAAGSMLAICAFVVFFSILSFPFTSLPAPWNALSVGILELFSFTPSLTPTVWGFVLASFCTGWGGLSVLCQTAAVLDGSGLHLGSCFRGKLVQGLLAALLAGLAAPYVL